jgi:hypothetical protein
MNRDEKITTRKGMLPSLLVVLAMETNKQTVIQTVFLFAFPRSCNTPAQLGDSHSKRIGFAFLGIASSVTESNFQLVVLLFYLQKSIPDCIMLLP